MREERLDSLRLYCNLMIVLVHAYPFMYAVNQTWELHSLTFISLFFACSVLPTLFFLSGYFLFTGYTLGGYWTKLKKRIRRLAVPYVLWNVLKIVIFLAVGLVSSHAMSTCRKMGVDTWAGWFDHILNVTDRPFNGPTWYLRALFLYVVASPAVYVVFARKKSVPLKILALLLLVFIGPYVFTDQNKYPTYSFVAFALGGWCGLAQVNPVKCGRTRGVFVRCFGFAGIVVPFAVSLVNPDFNRASHLGTMCSLITILFYFSFAEEIHMLLNHQWVREILMPGAFFVYCGHIIVNSFLMHGIGAVTPDFPGRSLFIAGVLFPSVLALSYMGYFAMRKLCPRVCSVLNGEL